ncbi:MAG: hypothetical protein IH899_04650 [Planctomycetes bacterium]|nr:hypothetical protein [Planctomycetota bacterium]
MPKEGTISAETPSEEARDKPEAIGEEEVTRRPAPAQVIRPAGRSAETAAKQDGKNGKTIGKQRDARTDRSRLSARPMRSASFAVTHPGHFGGRRSIERVLRTGVKQQRNSGQTML